MPLYPQHNKVKYKVARDPQGLLDGLGNQVPSENISLALLLPFIIHYLSQKEVITQPQYIHTIISKKK